MNRNTLSLGDRMKKYEDVVDYKLNPCMEYMMRLDGKGFSKMIKKWKCKKPFDERFNKAMNYASKKIFDIIPNIKTIWHGSDEISVWFECENVADMYFEGRIQKLVSLVASTVSVYYKKNSDVNCLLVFLTQELCNFQIKWKYQIILFLDNVIIFAIQYLDMHSIIFLIKI